jgi:hypothetical protein
VDPGAFGNGGVTIVLNGMVVNALNVNRVNYSSFVGTVGSPLFGRAVVARDPRQLQFSVRVRF